MENRSIDRYRTFCRSLQNLEKSLHADMKADFVLEGTVLNYNLTFDIAWKVMKDILIKELGILDFAVGSPRETLQQAFTNGIVHDDEWMQKPRGCFGNSEASAFILSSAPSSAPCISDRGW